MVVLHLKKKKKNKIEFYSFLYYFLNDMEERKFGLCLVYVVILTLFF
jgi:hypothetical protein